LFRSFLLNVLTETMVKIIMNTATITMSHTNTVDMIFQAFFIPKLLQEVILL